MLPVIDQPFPHDLMPVPDHDEHAREDFTVALKLYASEYLYPYDELVYEKRAKPKFVKEHGREPEDCDEVHHLMMDDPYTKFWSGVARNLQEANWYNQGRVAERQLDRMEAEAKKKSAEPLGSLALDPNFEMPKYIDVVDIHCMPGGYPGPLRGGVSRALGLAPAARSRLLAHERPGAPSGPRCGNAGDV